MDSQVLLILDENGVAQKVSDVSINTKGELLLHGSYRDSMVNQFSALVGISVRISQHYLAVNDWNFERALAHWRNG